MNLSHKITGLGAGLDEYIKCWPKPKGFAPEKVDESLTKKSQPKGRDELE
ncbi:MAG: hypothetical protein JW778_06010 [Candidatus Altiarchaeota archaeon]|nr:hypothetical protein [Candidatus Altiarchaeota archaeon]